MTKRLVTLAQLTEMALAQNQVRMAQIVRQETDLQRRLSDLDQAVQNRAKAGADTAFWAGVDPKWLMWLEQKRGQIHAEMARLRAQKEDLRPGLAKAFGRDQVARRLLQTARDADRYVKALKDERST